jgi:hypothetical protein
VRPNGLCGLPALQRVQGRNHRGHITRHCQRQSHAAPLPSTQHPHGSLLSRQRPGRRLSRLSTARAIQSVCPQASHPSKGCASSNTTARPHSLHEPFIALRQKPWPKHAVQISVPTRPKSRRLYRRRKYAVFKPWGPPTSLNDNEPERSLLRPTERQQRVRVISNARPIIRLVSGSNLELPKNCEMGMEMGPPIGGLRDAAPGGHGGRCAAGDPDSLGSEAVSRPNGMSPGAQMRFSYRTGP